MKDLYTRLDTEDINEDESIYIVGDDIVSSFYYGNFSQGVEELRDINCDSKDLLDYLQQQAEDYGMKLNVLRTLYG